MKKKLFLNKQTITKLNNLEKNNIKGGTNTDSNMCGPSEGCDLTVEYGCTATAGCETDLNGCICTDTYSCPSYLTMQIDCMTVYPCV